MADELLLGSKFLIILSLGANAEIDEFMNPYEIGKVPLSESSVRAVKLAPAVVALDGPETRAWVF